VIDHITYRATAVSGLWSLVSGFWSLVSGDGEHGMGTAALATLVYNYTASRGEQQEVKPSLCIHQAYHGNSQAKEAMELSSLHLSKSLHLRQV
tara:strand:+ start:2084 stop:2362 length:279 start_codon:yes stop_codon:yes gene_type:complete